jgi:hypothetical protein
MLIQMPEIHHHPSVAVRSVISQPRLAGQWYATRMTVSIVLPVHLLVL